MTREVKLKAWVGRDDLKAEVKFKQNPVLILFEETLIIPKNKSTDLMLYTHGDTALYSRIFLLALKFVLAQEDVKSFDFLNFLTKNTSQ